MSLQYLPLGNARPGSTPDVGTVLVVEDNSGDELFILRALRNAKLNTNVVVARDGQEALEFLFRQGEHSSRPRSTDPSVILLDLHLPVVPGIDVLRKIKSTEALRRLPVVVMTSNESERDLAECYELGANSVVQKGRFLEDFKQSVGLTVTYWTQVNVNSF